MGKVKVPLHVINYKLGWLKKKADIALDEMGKVKVPLHVINYKLGWSKKKPTLPWMKWARLKCLYT